MIKFLIDYVINKSIFKKALIEAATLTEAYIFFMRKYPDEYAITEIKETTGENLPADVEFPQKKKINYTILRG